MSKKNKSIGLAASILGSALVALVVATGAHAEGSGNPKNDLGWNTTQPAAHYVWKDGKLVPNPERDEKRNDGYQRSGN